jgi:hypothetical protein
MLEKICYRQWPNAYRISNDTVELIVLTDVGPRVIRYAFLDDDNVLHEIPEEAGLVGGDQFRLYGSQSDLWRPGRPFARIHPEGARHVQMRFGDRRTPITHIRDTGRT